MSKKVSPQEKAVRQEAKRLKYKTDILGPGSTLLMTANISSSRNIMANSQVGHTVGILNPEPALVSTGFEDVLGDYSTMLIKSDGNYEIVARFDKNLYNYVLVGYDKKRRHYTAWERHELEEHSEGFATRWKNTFMDDLDVGDKIKADQVIKKAENFDKSQNFCLGRNLNTIYMITTMTMEDGIALMNGAEKMMNTMRSFTIDISKNDNQLFLNLYGDKKHYQGFPEIGEKVKKGILCAVRTVDNSKAPYALKGKYLRQIEEGDFVYSQAGRVIDIDIRFNKEACKLNDSEADAQINRLYLEQQKYYHDLYTYMIDIVRHADDEGYTYSDEFSMICENAHKYVDATAFFSDQNESVFGNMMIKITVMEEEEMSVGSKMVGRSGNKGVVCKIVPEEESWYMEDGTPIHCVLNALGIVGRLNPAQLNEHSANELGRTIVRMMSQVDDLDEKMEFVYDLLEILNPKEKKALKKFYKNLDDSAKKKFVKKIERFGVIIIQDPIECATIVDYEKAYDKYDANWQHVVIPGKGKTLRKLLCAPMYFYRLKQDPLDKYSARSRGPVNPLYNLPAKSNLKKRYLEMYSDVAVRLGTAEIDVLSICNTPEAIADYMAASSTSAAAKDAISGLYDVDPSEELVVDDCSSSSKKNREILDAYLSIVSDKLVFEYEYAPEGYMFEV